MAYDEDLTDRIRTLLKRRKGVAERRMFGGIAFLVNGNMSCGVNGSDLMVRVGPDAYEQALGEKGARPMDFTGRPLRGMVFVGRRSVGSDANLRRWVDRGVRFARSLPAK